MKMIKVTDEKYRVYPNGKTKGGTHKDFENIMDAVAEAFLIAGRIRKDVVVDRITIHEPYKIELFMHNEERTETITGEYRVSFPHFASINISRYSPVNGWCIPEEIDVEKF
jgi:hypothetical protein